MWWVIVMVMGSTVHRGRKAYGATRTARLFLARLPPIVESPV
jgi:hypothetical protein